MICPVNTIDDIFKCWDTIAQMAEAVGEGQWKVQKWKQRGRIPQDSWAAVITAAKRKGKHLSADKLLSMHDASSFPRTG